MVAKKQPAKRKPVKARAKAKDSTQPAVDKRAAEAELRVLVDKFTPGQARQISAMRSVLRKRLPTAHELIYEYRDCFVISYSPTGRGYEGMLALRGSADGVRLHITGAKELPDPAKLLRSSGGQQRWIVLEGASTLARPEVVDLIDGAIALNDTPFDRTGRGSVTVRPTAAKKRGG